MGSTRQWVQRMVTVAAGVGLVVGSGGGGAAGVADVTPPDLRTPIKSSWLTGSQIAADIAIDCAPSTVPGDGKVYTLANQQFKWTAVDVSGPVRHTVTTWFSSGEWVGDTDIGTATSWSARTTNAHHFCGGGSHYVDDWDITATDAVGNAVTKRVSGGTFTLTQETGNHEDSNRAVIPTVKYSSTGWGTSRCACWSNGAVRRTSTAGASVSLGVDVAASGRGPVTHLGLVMHKGPDRGKFKVYVDGVLKATVDTYAATQVPRTIVWQVTLDDSKVHVVKVVNQATPGRARIDFDAVLTN